MSFFNRKEEVLDLELTQHGKKLLSNGKFKPDSYAFFDDDITYDTRYMVSNVKEEQNAAAERVRTTPRIHTQYNFRGIESNIDSPTSIQNIDDSDHYMKLPIGRCSIGSETAPAWNIKYLKNEILSASYVMSGTDMGSGQKFTDLPIPQLSSSITIKSYVEPTDKQVHNEDMYFKQNFKSENTTIKIKDDCLLIQIEEENVPFENENFSIEVYEIIDTDFKGNQILEPLKFFEDPNKPKKYGELYKETEGINKTDYAFNQSYVDYYFDIRVDTEIDQNLLCNYLGEDKVQNIFDVPIKCPDVKKQASIYGSLEQPLGDPCTDTDTSSTGNTGGSGGGGY